MKRSKWQIGLALVFSVLLVAGVAVAQEDTGGCYVLVSDATGARLPGATVTLSGYGAPRVQVSNANGEVRYPNLDPGSYQLSAELEGFSTVEYPAVAIRVGRSTTIEITLSEAVEETITMPNWLLGPPVASMWKTPLPEKSEAARVTELPVEFTLAGSQNRSGPSASAPVRVRS